MASVLPKNVRGQPLTLLGGCEDRHSALPGPERLLVLLFHVHLVAARPETVQHLEYPGDQA